eukprot:5558252-Amphidinium_carterae.4
MPCLACEALDGGVVELEPSNEDDVLHNQDLAHPIYGQEIPVLRIVESRQFVCEPATSTLLVEETLRM